MLSTSQLLTDPAFLADLGSPSLSGRALATKYGCSKTFVNDTRKNLFGGSPVINRVTNDSETTPSSTEESSDGSKAQTGIFDRAVTLKDARDWISETGDNPDDYNLSIRSSAWAGGKYANRMAASPKNKPGAAGAIDLVALEDMVDGTAILAQLRAGRTSTWTRPEAGSGTFVLSFNDTQFGKSEGGGTPATLARLDKCIRLAIARIEELRASGRELGTLVIIGGGDIVEGCVIYANQSYSLDLDRRGQINTAVAAILDMIDRLAPMFHDVKLLVARGNHGENRINGNRTTLYDNDDTLVFEMAQIATDRDPALKHVTYVIAQDEAGVCLDTSGWRLGTTHGDVYGKGGVGASIDKKAQNWYKNMSMGRDPIGLADVLITHHYHHDKMSDWGACHWRQTPALDGGSEYFRQSTGEYSVSGMLSFAMYPEARYMDEQVLR